MVERLGWTLVHFVWEGALIALVLALALPMVRQSAKARYALACVALLALARSATRLIWKSAKPASASSSQAAA